MRGVHCSRGVPAGRDCVRAFGRSESNPFACDPGVCTPGYFPAAPPGARCRENIAARGVVPPRERCPTTIRYSPLAAVLF